MPIACHCPITRKKWSKYELATLKIAKEQESKGGKNLKTAITMQPHFQYLSVQGKIEKRTTLCR